MAIATSRPTIIHVLRLPVDSATTAGACVSLYETALDAGDELRAGLTLDIAAGAWRFMPADVAL